MNRIVTCNQIGVESARAQKGRGLLQLGATAPISWNKGEQGNKQCLSAQE